MGVTSIHFIILCIATAVIYYVLDQKFRSALLTVVSLGFIATYSYYIVGYIILFGLFNYFLGKRLPDSKNKTLLYRIGIIVNISQLFILKYASFTIDPLLQYSGSSLLFSRLSELVIPIGVSYFTLQGIGYLINIKMGWEKPETKICDYLAYITFFPKFLSGPIERSNHFLPQLKDKHEFNGVMALEGLKMAFFGFFKKVAIANQLAPYVADAFALQTSADSISPIVMFLILPVYLYFDFSGYTDIVIGFSRVLGINILPNFNRPFFSENMTTFWKRFHITLGAWFNDYVFRQTVFKRRKWGIYASVYGVFLTFILFGIWHGAGWTFMILGLLQALVLNYEFLTRKVRYRVLSRTPAFVRIWIGRISTYLFYCVSMVFFFAPDLNSVFGFFSKFAHLQGTISLNNISLKPFELLIYVPVFFIIELLQNDYEPVYKKIENIWYSDRVLNRMLRWTLYSVIILIIFVVGLSSEQFVYVNF